MGDPRRIKKKYKGPSHPWQGARIESEKIIVKEYGLVKKTEVYKANSILSGFKDQAKRAITSTTKQGEVERKNLLSKLQRYGMISETSGLDDILGMTPGAILERRLQTIVVRKKLAGTMKQARQFILHGHILVAGTKVTAPSFIVAKEDEDKIAFLSKSALVSDMHPEREKALKERKKPKPKPEERGRRPLKRKRQQRR